MQPSVSLCFLTFDHVACPFNLEDNTNFTTMLVLIANRVRLSQVTCLSDNTKQSHRSSNWSLILLNCP